MATPNRLQALEQEYNEPIEVLIPRMVNKLGNQRAAADALGISQATISTWLKENGYIAVTQWVKESEDVHAA